ncbi:hypothetical protein [Streptomyces atratus]|uniref:hypothetical protein n=1 Tax=Streptomyces atratus TaxID=1893 RepID=UPI0021A95454|nr:hypothetical protein [Streptomyces atratus]MCT2541842.1 hypothetical protein [Streptomyces atratus]
MIGVAATPLDGSTRLLIDGTVHECTHLGQAGVGPSRVAQAPVATVAMLAAYRRARGGEVEEVQTTKKPLAARLGLFSWSG